MEQRIILSIGAGALAMIAPPGSLVGRWQLKVPGATILHVYRADSTCEIFVNGKTFTSGKYLVRQDTFATNSGCNKDYYGTYKLNFITPDSVQFIAIADTCQPRRAGLHKYTTGRQPK